MKRELVAVFFLVLTLVATGVALRASTPCVEACDAQFDQTMAENPGGFGGYTYIYAWGQWLLCVERCAPPIEAGLTLYGCR